MLGSIEEPEVFICVPQHEVGSLKKKIKAIPEENLLDSLSKKLKGSKDLLKLTVSEVRWIRENVKLDVALHEWLGRCRIELPEPPVIPRNPELEARVQRLKLEQQERDYQNMTRNVDTVRSKYPDDSIASQVKEINRQLIAVLQFVVSVGAGFAFGFIGVELIVGDLDFGFRLLLGVMCALIIALAEIYFLAKQLAEDVFPAVPPPLKSHQD
uniref:Endoplasmic reticulum-based factor for assembly of V-ATPase n=1 Tax=Graphocephala atropunctata TaxID=36148 RepID=A0A1B6KIT6_9HEMI